jgi:hypothetical protein
MTEKRGYCTCHRNSSRIEQQLDAIAKLPKAEQRAVSTVLDAVLAQHGAQIGQEAVTAS